MNNTKLMAVAYRRTVYDKKVLTNAVQSNLFTMKENAKTLRKFQP